MSLKKALLVGLTFAAVTGVAIQLIPYGRSHENPPVRVEPVWDSAETRALVVRACFACHSNETEWPWYSNVAPLSWVIQNHVDEGREELNFSEWDRPQEEPEESAEKVQEGEMPPADYLWLNAQARLSSPEKAALIAGLIATLGTERPDGDDDDHR